MAKVLLLDDDPSTVEAIKRLLSRRGLDILTATSADQALALATAHECGVALLDVRLGPGEDGIDVAQSLRSSNPDIRILFFTGYSGDHQISERLRSLGGHWALLAKPLGPVDTLHRVISEATDGYIADRAARRAAAEPQTPLATLDTIDLALYHALVREPTLLQEMDWRTFEKLLADVLETLGYGVELKRATKDGGIDIIALNRSTDWGEQRYLLQAKRWRNRVGIEPVQRLLFLKDDLKATKCCLATTSTFSRGAWALGREYRWELDLRDYIGIREWVERALRKKLNIPGDDDGTA